MLQDYFLFPHFNVKNNLIFSLPRETKNKKEKVIHFLNEIDMTEFLNHYPSELSGGQKARIACLRAIISNPDALLLDEPFSSLQIYSVYLSIPRHDSPKISTPYPGDYYKILNLENFETLSEM